jgi:hypothetical protein
MLGARVIPNGSAHTDGNIRSLLRGMSCVPVASHVERLLTGKLNVNNQSDAATEEDRIDFLVTHRSHLPDISPWWLGLGADLVTT